MNSRERLLLSLIGVLIVVMVGYYTISSVAGAFRLRNTRKMAAEKKLTDQKNTIKAGANAARQIAQLQSRSLPADREKAQSLYQRWLLDVVTDVGIDVQSVRPSDRRISGIYFDRVNFEIDGEATLPQAVEFLHRFYSSNDLHRIQQFNLRPVQDRESQKLDLSISIETMILPGNKRETVGDLASDRMGDTTLEDYKTGILGRNIFSPPNAPPSIKFVSNKKVNLGDELSVKISANDPDEFDKLLFSLVGYVPDGAEIDEETGTITWRPEKIEDVDFSVQVADSGTPTLTDEVTFTVTVAEAEVDNTVDDDSDGFDEADHAYLVGTISTGPKREIWLNIRTSGKLLRLSKGDRVEVGTVDGVVHEIGDKHASIRTDDGELLIRVGQNLSEGRVRPLQQAAR